ncbi:hypothetical protein C2L80_06300 [Rubneribacter badeniensis]|uniref:Uncharacterized protein n=1 Tax=Rubneribacter badeniensis TaxID=2070688 RepID=A0A2K2U5M4_9ACTN|nr:hypothetical protein C2L80_06300 [Rubneribacter badeniensis]
MERVDAAASRSTPPRGEAEGSRTEVRFTLAFPTIRGTAEALADVTNDQWGASGVLTDLLTL